MVEAAQPPAPVALPLQNMASPPAAANTYDVSPATFLANVPPPDALSTSTGTASGTQTSPGAASSASDSSMRDWRELVVAAAADLELRVVESPASNGEVHEHVTLRMLRLMVGETELALAPIPGISPIEQDYWSRQIFALATYLDHHSQPDDKRRAAAGALHLDEALNSLREVGSLSLRNLTFCKKVHAYGAYDPHEPARFSPGQPLTLYVEVENYHSRSTENGFLTSLGSSYELLDEAGKRVAGDSFPDVDDTCRTRRHDFHIQYGVALPATIPPGRYRLQLVIRDRQSDKLGNATVEFEVIGVKSPESRVESGTSGVTSPQPNITDRNSGS
jgi:hypothetical protein